MEGLSRKRLLAPSLNSPYPQLGLLVRSHGCTLADCTVLAQIRDCCDDLETCLLSSLGWTKPQRQDKTLETPKWSRSRAVGRSSSGSSPRKTPSRAEARQRIEIAGEP